MKITWLGQAGLLFETGDFRILIDPYLSDSVGRQTGNHRRVPVDETFLHLPADVLICTHNHLDHLDPGTVEVLLKENPRPMQVLGSYPSWQALRSYGGAHNYIMFNAGTEVTLKEGILAKAVFAQHSDLSAVGVILEVEEKAAAPHPERFSDAPLSRSYTFYITGDTLYDGRIFASLPEHIDAVFLPINGAGNNMNKIDAARFARKTGADKVVPLHVGMLDNLDFSGFACNGCVIPEIYREIPLF